MKNYIERHYLDLPAGNQRTYDQLRVIVEEAWDSITVLDLDDLIDSIGERCQVVIDAGGGYIKY
jgi:hypothetical protein